MTQRAGAGSLRDVPGSTPRVRLPDADGAKPCQEQVISAGQTVRGHCA